MAILPFLQRSAFRRFRNGQPGPWGALAIGIFGARKIIQWSARNVDVVYREELKPGEQVHIEHRSETRTQVAKMGRSEVKAAKKQAKASKKEAKAAKKAAKVERAEAKAAAKDARRAKKAARTSRKALKAERRAAKQAAKAARDGADG